MDAVELRPGVRVLSTACTTEAIVVKAAGPAVITCGGRRMVTPDQHRESAGDHTGHGDRGSGAPGLGEGTKLGKRYANAAGTIEVLCTKGGAGSIVVDGEELQVTGARLLPTSD